MVGTFLVACHKERLARVNRVNTPAATYDPMDDDVYATTTFAIIHRYELFKQREGLYTWEATHFEQLGN